MDLGHDCLLPLHRGATLSFQSELQTPAKKTNATIIYPDKMKNGGISLSALEGRNERFECAGQTLQKPPGIASFGTV